MLYMADWENAEKSRFCLKSRHGMLGKYFLKKGFSGRFWHGLIDKNLISTCDGNSSIAIPVT